jgi:hypothetical protein
MANYITIPYYYFWPIAFISFVLVFFLSTNTKVTLNKIYDINMTNYTNNNLNNLSLFKNQNEKNITETCKHFLNDVNDQKEIYLINKFNLTIKITVFILFGLTVLNIALVVFMVKAGACYDDDIGGYCQTWEYTCSYNKYEGDDIDPQCFWVFSIFIVICLGIIFLSAFSLYFSSEIKDKMTLYCNFELGEDYDIDLWTVSKAVLGIIIFLYFAEISFCVYSICFAILQFIKKSKMNKNNPDN